jgi:hypothetical protein
MCRVLQGLEQAYGLKFINEFNHWVQQHSCVAGIGKGILHSHNLAHKLNLAGSGSKLAGCKFKFNFKPPSPFNLLSSSVELRMAVCSGEPLSPTANFDL